MRSAISKPAVLDGSDGPLPVPDPPDPLRLDTELNASAGAAVAAVVGVAAGSRFAGSGVVGSAVTAVAGRLDTELNEGDAPGTVAVAAGSGGAGTGAANTGVVALGPVVPVAVASDAAASGAIASGATCTGVVCTGVGCAAGATGTGWLEIEPNPCARAPPARTVAASRARKMVRLFMGCGL